MSKTDTYTTDTALEDDFLRSLRQETVRKLTSEQRFDHSADNPAFTVDFQYQPT